MLGGGGGVGVGVGVETAVAVAVGISETTSLKAVGGTIDAIGTGNTSSLFRQAANTNKTTHNKHNFSFIK
ncbi:MAG: hypothetical protein DWQ04_33820 [Chloroflexi bacterium]|nr:MAG: hypothetical protein DWQ04_33820 [Chloroflexota bacterium]